MTALQRVLDALEETTGLSPRRQADGSHMARCAGHDDRQPSLHITETDEAKVLLHCFAGCSVDRICDEAGLKVSDLFAGPPPDRNEPEIAYPYVDSKGVLRYEKLRLPGKVFKQRRPDPNRPGKWLNNLDGVAKIPYRVPDLLARPGEPVWVTEGEKDADAIAATGELATTFGGTTAKYDPAWNPLFEGRVVTIFGDNDGPGRKYAAELEAALTGVAQDVRVVLSPVGKDAYDLLATGRPLSDANPMSAEDRATYGESSDTDDTGDVRVSPGVKDPKLKATRASTVDSRKQEFYLGGRIPCGEVTVICGIGGLGKSTFSGAWLAAEATSGRLTGEKVPVLLSSAEDDRAVTLRPRLDVAGADVDNIWFLGPAKEGSAGLTLPDNGSELRGLVESIGAQLIIIDPISAHLAARVDASKDTQVRVALDPLVGIAHDFGVAVIVVAHLNKLTSADLYVRLANSTGFYNLARSVLLLTADPEADEDDQSSRILTHGKCNVGPQRPALRLHVKPDTAYTKLGEALPMARFEIGAELPHLGVSDVLTPESAEDRAQVDEAVDALFEILCDGAPHPSKEIEAELKGFGFKLRTIQRAKKKLGAKSTKGGMADGWLWQLTEPETARAIHSRLSPSHPLSEGDKQDGLPNPVAFVSPSERVALEGTEGDTCTDGSKVSSSGRVWKDV